MSKYYGQLQDTNGNQMLPVCIDAGSNANGNYRKFADGTMICYGVATIPALSANAKADVTVTFPETFYSAPIVVATIRSSAPSYWSTTVLGESTTSFRLDVQNMTSSAQSSQTANWFAIHVWKS